MTTVIVYSKAVGRVRAIVYDAERKSKDLSIRLHSGEAVTEVDDTVIGDIRTPDALQKAQQEVTRVSGKTPIDDRYAFVNKDKIITAIVIADPLAGDEAPIDLTMVLATTAKIGDRLLTDGTTFVKPNAELDRLIAGLQRERLGLLDFDPPLTLQQLTDEQARIDSLIADLQTERAAI